MDCTSAESFTSILIGLLAQIQTIIPEPTTAPESTRKIRLLRGCRIDSELIGLMHYRQLRLVIISIATALTKGKEVARLLIHLTDAKSYA